jgi:hypothetical protein
MVLAMKLEEIVQEEVCATIQLVCVHAFMGIMEQNVNIKLS